MRVIAGSARRLLLKTAEGMDTRPTTDRIKETLFNILQNDIPGCIFMDLFGTCSMIIPLIILPFFKYTTSRICPCEKE